MAEHSPATAVDAACDVVVVGGGLIGAAAALGVAQLGRRVVLIERSEPALHSGRLGLDIRNVAVSPASRALLEALGVWSDLATAPYRRMEVWEERGTRAMRFDAGDVARAELGWIVENSPATVALWQALRRHEGVTVVLGELEEVAPTAAGVALAVAGRHYNARLLLGVDGAHSHVRTRLGVSVRSFDVHQVALASVVRTARRHDGVAYQRFLLDGPVALLPSRDPHLSSLVWSQSPQRAEQRRQLADAEFCRALERAVQGVLGAVEAVDDRVAFPLQQMLADSFNPHPRVLLLGDAARVIHPLAGLGANVGFEDVRDMLGVLGGLTAQADPGTAEMWRSFDRQRQARARLMVNVMGALRQVYARGDPVSQWVRNLGVGWLDRLNPIKRQIMVEAMGLGPVGRGPGR